MNTTFELVNTIVEDALDVPPGERAALLSERCALHPDLVAAAMRILSLSDQTGGFLASPVVPCAELRSGDILGRRFQILSELGAGGMGTTYLVDDRKLHQQVALKTLHLGPGGSTSAINRLRDEIRLARIIRHPNVCAVFDLFTFQHKRAGPIAAFTMQYLPGQTLAQHLADGPLAYAQILPLARGIASGIEALHAEGVVHRDLKPANIILTTGRHGIPVPIIIDFGLAATNRAVLPRNSNSRALWGTAGYMAPEQFRGGPVTGSSDIFAFGLILFEIVAGPRSAPAATEAPPRLRDVAPHVPRAWDSVISRALSRDPADRPRSATGIVDVMEHTLGAGTRCTRACHKISAQAS